MKILKPGAQNLLMAAALALPLWATTTARADEAEQPPMMTADDQGAGQEHGPQHDGPHRGGPEQGTPGPRGFGPEHGPGPGFGFGPMPFQAPFHRVKLSEEQEDKVFAILHAEAPYLREQGKAAARAQRALHELAEADQYDDAKAAALAKEIATAEANIALQHVRTRQKLRAVLTAEQRKQLAEEQPQHPPRP